MPHFLRRFTPLLLVLALLTGALGALAGCAGSSEDDDDVAFPTAFISPVDGKQYCGWRNTPHECDESGLPAAPFALPDDRPADHDPNHSLLLALFVYHAGFHSYYHRPWYHDNYIEPAWRRHPHQPNYRRIDRGSYERVSRDFDTRHRSLAQVEEKKVTYQTAKGKTYKGNQVPQKLFAGTNAKPKAGGNAPGVTNPQPSQVNSPRPGTTGTPPGNQGTSPSAVNRPPPVVNQPPPVKPKPKEKVDPPKPKPKVKTK